MMTGKVKISENSSSSPTARAAGLFLCRVQCAFSHTVENYFFARKCSDDDSFHEIYLVPVHGQ